MEIDDFTPVQFPSDEEIKTLFDGFPDMLTGWDVSKLLDPDFFQVLENYIKT